MRLSILICSLGFRKAMLDSLVNHLNGQINNRTDLVEIITYVDNKERSTGFKRQSLLNQAKGDYVVFIDDDDFVPIYYVDEMLKACESGLDCFAIRGTMTTNGAHETQWFISKEFKNEDRREGNQTVYYRRTNHITGVKRSIALVAGFPDKSNAEDKHYSDRLVLKTEFKINPPMYWYRFTTANKQYK